MLIHSEFNDDPIKALLVNQNWKVNSTHAITELLVILDLPDKVGILTKQEYKLTERITTIFHHATEL